MRDKATVNLLLITNRKSHIDFRIIWQPLTLDDLEGQYALLWQNGKR